jgi:hypothetical protein
MFSAFPRVSRMLVPAFCSAALALVASAAESIDFNRQIRPILADACFRCHGPDEGTREAKLRLDEREGVLRTRDDVTVVTPGAPEESELWLRIVSEHEDEVMPPRESSRQLKPDEKALLKRWIEAGAPWGVHWAFTPPQRPPVPVRAADATGGDRAVQNPIDAFVRARLAKESLSPSPEAARETLLRRVTLDLTGLPPTRGERDAFLADASPEAYERVVDRLLASPRYGERWAWDWLDLARYADTNGFQGDPERTMWPWRDWVVTALNANMPYDRFTIEQLAGDLLPNATREQKIASGFNRNNMFNGEGGRIPEETRVENIFDRVDTTSIVWMGLTFGCARCHDHKYDPIRQADYFSFFDVFNQLSETGSTAGSPRGGQINPILDLSSAEERERLQRATERIEQIAAAVDAFESTKFPRPAGQPLADSPELSRLPGDLPTELTRNETRRREADVLAGTLRHFRDADPDPAYAALLQTHLEAARAREAANAAMTRVMIMDQLEQPRDTFVLNRGNYESKSDLQVFGAAPSLFRRPGETSHAGNRMNRLDLARWLVSPENPLAARVAVNRAWQAFFGTGIVKTSEDFGVQSEPPSHLELLDWLATEFVATGWDVKALHRLIVTSATYRQSSRVTPAMLERDPENRLLARAPRFRLPSWMIRDQALAVAGLLVEQRGGPGVKPYQPAGVWEEATFNKKTYVQDHGEALYRRSLYVFWRRIVGPTSFFDAGARQVCTVKVARTNTPLHALVTLNDPAFVEAGRVLAQSSWLAAADDRARVEHAFLATTARLPTERERAVLFARLDTLRAQFAADPAAAAELASAGEAPRPESLPVVEHAAWTVVCALILNLDETLSKE